MSSNNRLLSDYVYLAEASYADFEQENGKYKKEKVEEAIKLAVDDKQPERAASFAELVTKNYEVVAHWKDRGEFFNPLSESGFSGTLFQGKSNTPNAGKYVLAMRGTEGGKDIFITDAADIVNDGLAHHQIVDMYNFWQQIKAEKGKPYRAAKIIDVLGEKFSDWVNGSAAEKQALEVEWKGKGYFVDTGSLKRIVFVDSDDLYGDERAHGLGIDPQQVVVTGHSLGGHLSAGFSRLFPEAVEHAYMVNGAGYGSDLNPAGYFFSSAPVNIFQVFSALDGMDHFDADKITNFIGDKNIDFVSNNWFFGLKQPGSTSELFIEEVLPSASNLSGHLLGHGADQMTDTMAVIDLFVRLDKQLQDKPVAELLEMMNGILKAAEADDTKSLETIVDKLGEILVPDKRIKVDVQNRESLYKNILTLQEQIEPLSQKGSFTVKEIDDSLTGLATSTDDSGLAARYALAHLNPFILEGNVYAQHNQHGELKLFDVKHAANGMTDQYIEYRSKMLENSVKNSLYPNSSSYKAPSFLDIASDTFVPGDAIGGGAVIFGSDQDDRVDAKRVHPSSEQRDYLFGGDGADTLIGWGGNDYLEGGKGHDTYIVDGHDEVFDYDLDGHLVFGKDELVGWFFEKISDTEWQRVGQDGNRDAHWVAERIHGDDLLVKQQSKEGEAPLRQVTVKDFFALQEASGNASADGYKGLSLNLSNAFFDAAVDKGGRDGEVKLAVVPNKSAQIYGSPEFQHIYGSTKGDIMFLSGSKGSIVASGDGDDRIFGSPNPDEFNLGDGNDVAFGSSLDLVNKTAEETANDKDILIGGKGKDLLMGVGGDDIIYADNKDAAFSDQPDGDGDWLLGNEGNDILYGGRGNDFLNGGEGVDTIYGSAGDDVILGDGNVQFGVKSWSYVDTSLGSGPTYTPGSPTHPWIPPGINVTYPSSHHNMLSVEYTFKNGQFTSKGVPNLYLIHHDTHDWSVTVNTATGDYSLNRKVDLRADIHRVAEGGATDYLMGGAGNDLIIGQDGDDVLTGGAGDDILWGDDNRDLDIIGHDILMGGIGDDLLYGGKGNDELYAGKGNDTLEGGEGADTYYFHHTDLSEGINLIKDFGDNSAANGGLRDEIVLDGKRLPDFNWVRDKATDNQWSESSGYTLNLRGNTLIITHRSGAGKIYVHDFADGDYALSLLNKPPQVGEHVQSLSGETDSAFSYTFADNLFTDPDGDALTYRVEGLPAGLTFDAATKTISGTPQSAGDFTFKLIATDPDGESASQDVRISIEQSNHAPEVAEQVAELSVDTDSEFNYTFADNLFTDLDGDKLSYQVEDLPNGLVFDSVTKTLKGTPTEAGEHTFKLIANDGRGGTASQNVRISVTHINHAPEVRQPLDTQLVTLRDRWQWAVPTGAVVDPDGDPLSFQLDKNAPSWLSISHDGTLSGTPPQQGPVYTSIIVSDPHGEHATLDLNLNVTAPTGTDVKKGLNLGSLGDDRIYGSEQSDTLRGLMGNDELFGWGGDDILVGGSGNDTLHGGDGNDRLDGSLGDDMLFGDAGNDVLKGQLGNDTLHGGLGDDRLEGGWGDDTYVYHRGDGHDTIRESGGNDTLILDDYKLEDLRITLDGGDLNIATPDSSDHITIEQWHAWFGMGKVEKIKLSDTTLNAAQLEKYADGNKHVATIDLDDNSRAIII